MAKSLLAHLYTHIRGSQEDIATLSLQYILSQSEVLRDKFNDTIGKRLNVDLSDVHKYYCQVTGDDKERPDMAGVGSSGDEIVLCEAKFYAGLTQNQPVTYLKRLEKRNGKGLIFICPRARITPLWGELIKLCKDQNVNEIDKYCIKVNGLFMAIITWQDILYELRNAAVSIAKESLSDLEQLIGYCEEVDMDAFIPFNEEELQAITARKQRRYSQVILEVCELLRRKEDYSTSNATRSSYNGGFEYRMMINDHKIMIAYDENLWLSSYSIETPFWLAVTDKNTVQDDALLSKLKAVPEKMIDDKVWGIAYLALQPLPESTLDKVAEDIVDQIISYMKLCEVI
ncbi:MAG: hypothetical protein E7228_04370 [Clostridiales bacterium]|nr:hypothetical protein [Clostridiales bacterium]